MKSLCLAVVTAFVLVATDASAAGKAENIESKATQVDKARAAAGKDPNIKSERPAANAPEQKGKEAPKKRACTVIVDSRVNLYVDIYVDGEFRGTMGPYGDGYTLAIAGPTRLYARANFTDGSYSYWGPSMVECPEGGSHTWTLRP